ncbi:MAG: general secretion pathway protein GspD, partial [Methyloversatilis sp.]|nr:general secretion pathway protein GspD [Methyloversatilis sp.]
VQFASPSRAVQPEPAPAPEPEDEAGGAELRMQSSGEVTAGGEAGVIVSMTAGAGVRNATIEIVYDPNVLTALGTVTAPGRAAVTLSAAGPGQEARAELRFRAAPNAPAGASSVQVGNVVALGADGNPLQINAPSPVDIVIRP